MCIKSTNPVRRRALVLAVSLALGSGQAAAATFTVTNSNDSGLGSLREAVGQANANPGADLIDFSTGLSTITLSSGQIEISEDLQIIGPAEGQTISGGNASRILAVTDENASLTLENLALVDGFNGAGGSSVYCAGYQGSGGAICAEGELTVRDCTISGNATSGNASMGGGLWVRGALAVESSVITGNTTTGSQSLGGGVAARNNVTLIDSVISGNVTQGDNARGGGMFVSGILPSITPTVTLERSAVVSNATQGQLADGGGMAVIQVNLDMRNSTVSANETAGTTAHGGGVWGYYVTAEIYNSTITSNSAGAGGGGLHLEDQPVGVYSATLDSTILAANTGPDGNVQSTGNTLNVEFSLFGDAAGEITGANSNNVLNDAPSLSALDDQDCAAEAGAPGMAQCAPGHVPQAGSPAIDAGRNALALSSDQRGPGFPRTFGPQTDVGALEAGAELDVVPSVLDFGSVVVGSTSAQQLATFSNPGIADVTFSPSQVNPSAPFSRPSTGCNLLVTGEFEVKAGTSCQLGFQFSPSMTGLQSQTLIIDSSAPGTDELVLRGTGTSTPVVDVTPDPVTFLPRQVGDTSPPQTVTIRNAGSVDLSLGTLNVAGADASDFNLASDGCSGQTLGTQAGIDDSCQFDLTFTPSSEGVSQASVTIPSNAPSSPDSVALSGASDVIFSDRFE